MSASTDASTSEVFAASSRYVDELAELNPTFATSIGLPGHDDRWGDTFGVDGHEARMDLARGYRSVFASQIDATDGVDRVSRRTWHVSRPTREGRFVASSCCALVTGSVCCRHDVQQPLLRLFRLYRAPAREGVMR